MNAETLRRILEPEPGTALARAKHYGIDLTLITANLERTPDERFNHTASAARFILEFKRRPTRP